MAKRLGNKHIAVVRGNHQRSEVKPIVSQPVLRLLVSSDIRAAQLLNQNSNDADEQNKVDLEEKHKPNRKFLSTTKNFH